jgi:hypothetical protein
VPPSATHSASGESAYVAGETTRITATSAAVELNANKNRFIIPPPLVSHIGVRQWRKAGSQFRRATTIRNGEGHVLYQDIAIMLLDGRFTPFERLEGDTAGSRFWKSSINGD